MTGGLLLGRLCILSQFVPLSYQYQATILRKSIFVLTIPCCPSRAITKTRLPRLLNFVVLLHIMRPFTVCFDYNTKSCHVLLYSNVRLLSLKWLSAIQNLLQWQYWPLRVSETLEWSDLEWSLRYRVWLGLIRLIVITTQSDSPRSLRNGYDCMINMLWLFILC